jgi:hypothetical protein
MHKKEIIELLGWFDMMDKSHSNRLPSLLAARVSPIVRLVKATTACLNDSLALGRSYIKKYKQEIVELVNGSVTLD